VGTVQGNGKEVLQVTSKTGAETCDVFEVVFYPALASYGGDDSGGVLRSERVKRIVSYAPRRTSGEGRSSGEGKWDNLVPAII